MHRSNHCQHLVKVPDFIFDYDIRKGLLVSRDSYSLHVHQVTTRVIYARDR